MYVKETAMQAHATYNSISRQKSNVNIHLSGNDSCLYHVPKLADGGVHVFWINDFLLFRECN